MVKVEPRQQVLKMRMKTLGHNLLQDDHDKPHALPQLSSHTLQMCRRLLHLVVRGKILLTLPQRILCGLILRVPPPKIEREIQDLADRIGNNNSLAV